MSQPLCLLATASVVLVISSGTSDAAAARSPQGPLGRLSGKQLFIDDHIIDEMRGLTKMLNRPVKHRRIPLVVPNLPWEEHAFYANGTVIYDSQDRLF